MLRVKKRNQRKMKKQTYNQIWNLNQNRPNGFEKLSCKV